MLRIALKTTLAQKRRLIGTALSVVIGIAFLAGTFVFTDTIKRTFDTLFTEVYATTDAYVRSNQSIDAGFAGTQRGRIDDSVIDEVAAVDGVDEVAGEIFGFARILGKDGKPLGQENGAPTAAQSVSNEFLQPWDFTEGRAPTGPDEVALDRSSFKSGDFELGDQVTVLGQTGSRTYTLVGAARFAGADSPGGATFALFDLPTAQEFLNAGTKVDGVLAASTDGLDEDELVARVKAEIPSADSVEVLTGTAIAEESASAIKDGLSFFNTFLLVFAGIALFVSSFIIYNTFSIIVAQRTRENALLRAVGASRNQITATLLVEALIVGVIASLLGFLGGIVTAQALEALLAAVGIDIPAGGLVLSSRTLVVSLIVGVGVTVVASLAPAFRAAKVPPVAAMRDVAIERRDRTKSRLVAGLLVGSIGAALTVLGLTGQVAFLGLGIPLLFIGVFVLGPLLARPVGRFLGAPLPKVKGMTGTLARENAVRNPKRTARTAAALMVGVALVTGITVLAASVKDSIREIIGDQFTGDFVVNTNTFGFGGLSPQLASDLDELDEVGAAAGVQIGFALVDGDEEVLSVVDPGPANTVFDLQYVAGDGDIGEDEIALSESQAGSSDVTVGDTMSLRMLDGLERTVTVRGIYANDELAGPFTVSKELYRQSGTDEFDFAVFVQSAEGVSEDQARAAMEPITDEYANAELLSRSEYVDEQAAQVNQFVNLVYGLLALAVVIAVFGIANTLSLSVFERTRELGLLRAVGMTRAQVRSTVRWESVITALLGAIQGVVIGIFLGYAVIIALRDEGLNTFTLPVTSLVVVLALAVVAGVLAAVRPARRAARLDVLEAIATGE
jgi:putative ABC transport system permease protein